MKKMIFILGISFMFLLIGQAKGYTQDYYTNQTSSSVSFGYTIFNSLNDSLNSCETTVDYYADINNILGTNYNYLFRLYLNGNLNFSATIASPNNQSCLLLVSRKMYNSSYVNATFSFQSFSGGGIPVTIRAETHAFCDSNDTYVTFDGGKIHRNAGSGGYQVPASGGYGTFLQPDHIFSHCNGQLPASGWSGSIGCSGCKVVEYTYPFFSGNGSVFLNITDPGCTGGTPAPTCSIYNIATNTTTFLFSCGGISSELNYSLNLQPLTEYRLICSYYLYNAVVNPWSMPPLPFYMDINDITPDYICTTGSCINGSAIRNCVDAKGKFPNTIQTISCLGANQTIYLGFEDSTPSQEQRCIKTAYPFCFDSLENITAGFPNNPPWTIFPSYPAQYFATITGEAASKGFQSLKLWTIPPSPPLQPILSNATVICGNATIGTIPQSYISGLNATFFVSYNFTFPSTTMHILADIKKCSQPVVQYDGWCGKSCFSYLGNCTISPRGDYYVALYDNTNSSQVLFYTGESTDNWSMIDIDLSNNIAILDHTYTLTIGVGSYPLDYYQPYSWCSYFDNVKLFNAENSSLDQIALELYGLPYDELTPTQQTNVQNRYCTQNECIGNDLYIRNIQNGVCVSKVQTNYQTCVTQAQQQATAGNQSIFTPISSIGNIIVNSTTGQTMAQSVQAAGFGFALVFLTPIFWIMLICAIVMIIATYYTKHMEIGVGAGLFILIAFTLALPELIWITIVLLVISAYIVGRSIVKVVSGNG